MSSDTKTQVIIRNSLVLPLLFVLPPLAGRLARLHVVRSSHCLPMTSRAQILSPCCHHGRGIFWENISNWSEGDGQKTDILAASKTASRVESSESLSFSNSVLANCRPLPMAAP